MSYFIGIDLGTSACKLLLVNEIGKIERSVSKSYPLLFPHQGWSEQNPEDWWRAVRDGLSELLIGIDTALLHGIGCGGQMHGLVILDEYDNVIRPAILWNDGRTAKETDFLNQQIGKEKLSELTANIAFAGFTAPKLMWLENHEPQNFAKIAKIMLPKDYINYMLTGVHACDYSDASGMLLLDVKNKRWSKEMLSICHISEDQLPKLFESYQIIGNVCAEIGIPKSVKVIAGAGDNAAAAVGTGTVGDGRCNISLGTSGTVFISSHDFGVDTNNALHSFAHADGNYHLMGCMLSAASCNQWLCEEILHTSDYSAEQKEITEEKMGKNSVYFLPYLMGERSPINDTNARGTFLGLHMDTSRSDLVQAVLEGVAFAIRDSVEVARSLGLHIDKSTICGGGAKSALWCSIFANVLNIPLEIPQTEEGPGYGAAMLAMVGCGRYSSVQECAEKLVFVKEKIVPKPEIAARYEKQYKNFREIYPTLKNIFSKLQEEAV